MKLFPRFGAVDFNRLTKKQTTIRLKCLTVLAVLLAACDAQSMNELKFDFTVDQAALESGKVILNVDAVNTTGQTLSILPWNTPLDDSISGRFYAVHRVADSTKVDVPYVGRMIKRMAPESSDYLKLTNGARTSQRQDVTKSYTFCSNQRYIISYSGQIQLQNGEFISANDVQAEFRTGDNFDPCN